MTRRIMLDVDGVLCTYPVSPSGRECVADPRCVAVLNEITSKSGAVIVVTSSLRFQGEAWIRAKLERWGVTGTIEGCTPRLPESVDRMGINGIRTYEIVAYSSIVNDNKNSGDDGFVVIDDERSLVDGLWHRVVCPNRAKGLEEHHVERALRILDRRIDWK
jgi:hypothetical protein